MYALFTGLLLGFSLIISIGAQNLFLIKQGVYKQRPYLSATICGLCDALLISLSITSLGVLLMQTDSFKTVLSVGGSAFLTGYGLKSLWSAL